MVAIGAGRVGTALAAAATAASLPYRQIDREHGWEVLSEPEGEPVLVLVRNDDLAAVIDRVPPSRRPDLVFVQNGAMREFLASRYMPHATRGILYFAVPSRGAPIQVGAESVFCGHHAPYLVQWFGQSGIASRQAEWARFSLAELEKMVWISAFGALGDAYDEDVGTIAENRVGEVAVLADELRTVGRAIMGVDVELDWLVKRLCGYSARIPRFRAGVREFTWRNGWFVHKAQEWNLPTAMHIKLLQAGGHWPA